MLFESTSLLLQSIVQSLESDSETRWEDHLEFGNQCIYELYQMSRPTPRRSQAEESARKVHVATGFERAIRAIPHVKSMNSAVRRKDRMAAIQSGRAAIAEMNGTSTPRPYNREIIPQASDNGSDKGSDKAAPAVNRRTKPAPERKRTGGAKRRAGRVLTASSR